MLCFLLPFVVYSANFNLRKSIKHVDEFFKKDKKMQVAQNPRQLEEEEEDEGPLIDENDPIVKYAFLGLTVFIIIVALGAAASLISCIAVLIVTLVKKVRHGDY